MRAALLREELHRLSLEDVTLDKPLRREVRVQIVASGLCHSDLHFIDGMLPTPFPLLLGHEAAGVVVAVGEDVQDVAVGDHVITCLTAFCGRCDRCLSGQSYLCPNRERVAARRPEDGSRVTDALGNRVHQSVVAAFAEEMLVHENAVVKITPDMPLDRAALIGCAVTAGFGAVVRTAEVRPGNTVAVVGCGGVGMAAIQGARLVGARTIIAVDTMPTKLEWATDLGATHAVDPADGDPVAQVLELTAGGVDHSFECIGLKPTIEQAYAMLAPGGTCTVVGVSSPGVNVEIPALSLLAVKRLQGSFMGSSNFKVDMPHLCSLYLDGRLKLDEMVSRTIALEDINDGFDAMRDGTALRSVIRF